MNKKLKKYSQKEISNIESNKIKIAISEDDIIKFVDEASNTKNSNKKIYLGIVSNKLARTIYRKTKINIKNYNISLKIDSIKHILSHHSNEKEYLRGQIPINNQDFLLITKIITNYDSIRKSGFTKEGKPSIKFTKQLKNTYYLIGYVSDKHYNLEIQTIYKK